MSVIERVSLDTWTPPWLRFQHIARYEWAAEFAAGARVLDAACGTGYGSRLLAGAGAASVVGVDVDPATVEVASGSLASPRLSFACADAAELPLAAGSIDLYTSFETIEHIAADEQFVAEAARVVRPGGRFLCSTPNRLLTNPRTTIADQPFNRFHIREYSQPELDTLLRRHFREVHWRGQTFFTRRWQAVLQRLAGWHRMLAVRCHQVRKLLCLPWERAAWHAPLAERPGRLPEYLVAECVR
jgi:SAM-dependent methyltransferase